MRGIILFVSIAMFFASVTQAVAEVSVHQRDGYDRIVIEGAGVNVESEKDKSIDVRAPTIENYDTVAQNTPTIETVSKNGSILSFNFSDVVTDTRFFNIGSRLILDLFFDRSATPPGESTEEEEVVETVSQPNQDQDGQKAEDDKPNQEQAATDALDPLETLMDQTFDAVLDQSLLDIEAQENETESPVEAGADSQDDKMQPSEDTAPQMENDAVTENPLAQPTILTLSSTNEFGLAVFQRYNRLFLVTDSETMGLPPQITGAGKDLDWEITDIDMRGGNAWMLPLPDGAHVRPEGGRLIWRIVISDQNPDLKSASLERVNEEGQNPEVRISIADASEILRFQDPDYKDYLAVYTVKRANQRMLESHDYVDFDVLPAVVGAVIKPQSDGVRVSKEDDYIVIEKRGGLLLADVPQDKVVEAFLNPATDGDENRVKPLSNNRVFFFDDWSAGVTEADFNNHRQALELSLVRADDDAKTDGAFELAKFYLSKAMGQEALGYLEVAADQNAEILKMPEYNAMKGAAHFFARQYDLASESFSPESLMNNTEILLWHSASLGARENYNEAAGIYPGNAAITATYPFPIRMQVLTPIAQSMIETNQAAKALELVEILETDQPANIPLEDFATIAYLKGYAEKNAGYPEKAVENLTKASLTDKLGPYGIRSEMMVVEDALRRETIEPDDAIKRMERLRFAWRGDALENEIYKTLGQIYMNNNQPRQGLNILKRSAETAPTMKQRREIVRTMAQAYKDLFMGEDFEALDPVEAISVYDEFKELTPVGEEGNLIIDRLADKLMDIGLMSRAVSVLQDKMERLEGGRHAIKTGLRIAAIQLLDRQPQATMETLSRVDDMMMDYDGEEKDDLHEKIVMLKARTFSDLGETENALFIMEGLPDTDDVLRLRVDTAWRSGNWVAVSDSLDKLILRENLSTTTPPTQQQAQIILNQAIALNLSEQYDALQRFANRYDVIMQQSPAYKTFQLVTRPSQIATLADRETLLGLTSEVDLFNAFLENTKGN
jgi:hypothetical protein